jgi:tetratricopeptide (TPR) repeat protein
MDKTTQMGEDKNERLHQIALSLFRNNDNESALKCWKRIIKDDPDFPDIDRWIESARKRIHQSFADPEESNRRRMFRSQMTLAEHYGYKLSNKTRFQIRSIDAMPMKRIRHRHIAYLLMIGFFIFLWGSARNFRTFLLVHNHESGDLLCYKGTFFPYGWELEDELTVGLTEGWENDLGNPSLTRALFEGIKIHGIKALDNKIIEIYKALGSSALATHTIEKQELAIYYFSRIEKARYGNQVSADLASAYFNLAGLHSELQDKTNALKYLSTAKKYKPTYPGLKNLHTEILQLP